MLKQVGEAMPTIAQIGGIKIQVFFEIENPPHIHVEDAGRKAKLRISDGAVIVGRLRNRTKRLVLKWLEENREFAQAKWGEFYQGKR